MEADASLYQRGCASHRGSPNQLGSSSAVDLLRTNGPLSRSRTTSNGGSRPTLLEVFDGELAQLSSVKPTRNNQRLLAAEQKPLGTPHKTSEFSTRNGMNYLKAAFRSVVNRIETLDLKLQSLGKETNERVSPLIQHGINAALEGFCNCVEHVFDQAQQIPSVTRLNTSQIACCQNERKSFRRGSSHFKSPNVSTRFLDTAEQIGNWSVSLPAVGRFLALESFEGGSRSNQAFN